MRPSDKDLNMPAPACRARARRWALQAPATRQLRPLRGPPSVPPTPSPRARLPMRTQQARRRASKSCKSWRQGRVPAGPATLPTAATARRPRCPPRARRWSARRPPRRPPCRPSSARTACSSRRRRPARRQARPLQDDAGLPLLSPAPLAASMFDVDALRASWGPAVAPLSRLSRQSPAFALLYSTACGPRLLGAMIKMSMNSV